ncbi:hypothetical protein TELCIR_11520 [Teladorsagia circumcincta]|uniref:Uncharacterized protein n=1 Tax=Teladorsagia circumcincta TaxID=45464 RepID=A0A2G9U989_TELCI|nr:hypothetical protein TELCIR_11520 [Teladorsagia circumcincta]
MLPSMRARFCVRLTLNVHRCMSEQSASFTSEQGNSRWRQQQDYRKANQEDSQQSQSKSLITLHGKRDSDPEFIGVSLKLADIFAQKGQLDDAETGFSHCVRKQMQAVDEHMKSFSVAHGALVEDRHVVDTHGGVYTDPPALFGMALERYAHFLITYRDETRLREAEEYMDEVMKEEALEWARKAVLVSKSEEPRVQRYAERFLRDLERDAKGKRTRSWWLLW